MGFLALGGCRIEYETVAGPRADAPLVFLHEGLGSVAMWRDFPARLAHATGCPAVIYSRRGYGRSDPRGRPHAPDYMHREALDTLPALRAALGLANPILVGHSDGASIALMHAAAARWPVRGLVLEAPHVFVEEMSLAAIRAAREAFAAGDLARRLARYHADAAGAFHGWNDIWLDPAFRAWNITGELAAIACPSLLVQGADDAYGTAAQLDVIAGAIGGRCERLVLPDCGHAPHRERPDVTLQTMTEFISRL